MDLVVRPERDIDFAATAALAIEGFGAALPAFSAERMRWLYGRAFAQGTQLLALEAEGRKVGQVALVGQSLRVGDGIVPAAALMDVFVLPAFRSREAIGSLYAAAERHCRDHGIAWLLGVPNRRAVNVNRRLLGLETAATLDIRFGAAPPPWPGRLRVSSPVAGLDRATGLALLADYLPGTGCGLAWTPESLWERLHDPSALYGLHATDDLLLVSSARTRRRVPFTLLCGLFARPGARVGRGAVRLATAAACWLHRRPLFIYVGLNRGVPLPGLRFPERLRPSLMIVQARALSPQSPPLALDRFECLDFDFG